MKWINAFLAFVVVFVLAGCGGGGNPGTSVFGGTTGTGTGTGTTTSTATVAVAVSGDVTISAPATVTLTVKDASGNPLPNTLVTLTTKLGTLAVLSKSSVSTGSDGTASVTLTAADSGSSGADQVIAVADLGTTTVQGVAAFNVQTTTSSVVAVASGSTISQSSGPISFSATVRDDTGALLAGQIVNFSSANSAVVFSATSALTNSSGVATVQVSQKDPTVNAADQLIASATVNGKAISGTVPVSLVAQLPSLTLSLSSTTITSNAPATLRAAVKTAAGAAVPNVVVTFTSTLGSFDNTTALTDSSGVASAVLSPKTLTTSGADTIGASAVVSGITVAANTAVTFSASGGSGNPVLSLSLSSGTVTVSTPDTVSAKLVDASGAAVAGQVVTFSTVRGLGTFNVLTALTNTSGVATVIMSPASAATAGADEVSAAASYAGVSLQALQGFTVQATSVTITSFTAGVASLSAYGQTNLQIGLSSASVSTPVNLAITSSCVSSGKATVSPATLSATTTSVTVQYTDQGCGALQNSDQLQVAVVNTTQSASLTLPIASPAVSSLAFVQAVPPVIYLKGSGLGEVSIVTFQVRDSASNPLANQDVVFNLLTTAGGVTMEDGQVPVTKTSDASGQVSVRINSGSVPTPVRVSAALASNTSVSTVSSGLSVAVGLPSQVNFSMGALTSNIEGMTIDGTPDTFSVIASDRSGNPVPAGTSINFVTTGGQIEAIGQTQLVSGLARTSVNFISSEPRPTDGRVTVTSYALGEESFLDLNGNNTWDPGEPFQDLGNVFMDRNFNGLFDPSVDEYVPLNVANTSACVAPTNALLDLSVSIPSEPMTCDGTWSGAGSVYVRRATQIVLSTSVARPLWGSYDGLVACPTPTLKNLQIGPPTTVGGNPPTLNFVPVVPGSTWLTGNVVRGTLTFIVGDANDVRLNPMAAGTIITATATSGLTVTVVGGSPVPNTLDAGTAAVTFEWATGTNFGTMTLSFQSPSGLATSIPINLSQQPQAPGCSP